MVFLMIKHTKSYYAATQNTAIEYPVLKGSQQADVCIVGAGFSGVSAALHLVERGYSVAIIEAQRVGWGASGRNGGQWAGFYSPDMAVVEKLVGQEQAQQLWAMNEESKAIIKERVNSYKIDCDYKATGLFMAAYNKTHLQFMQDKIAEAQRYNYPHLQAVSQQQVADYADCSQYVGGLFDADAGHVHPLNLVCGQAKAASDLGAAIYQGSEVIAIEYGKQPVVKTAQGQVQAKYVIVCGNGYLAQGKAAPAISRKILPVTSYILATEPLPEEVHRKLLPKDCSAFDYRYLLDYYRLSADKRLLFGGGTRYSGKDPSDIVAWRLPKLLKTFPQLKPFKIDYAWGGTMGFTYNRMPAIGRVQDNVFYAQGYSGHGVALTHLGGRLVAEAVAGTAERFDVFNRIKHMPFPGGKLLRVPMLFMGANYYSIRDALRN
tara:strand:+ start:36722 stop:38020 length:1299 start_codon:yes stop_codon:yes gene_type:complete